jgi:hypothetical protein
MSEEKIRSFDFKQYQDKITLQKQTLVPLLEKLINKIKRQGETPIHMDVFVRVHMLHDQLEKMIHDTESTIAALDLGGKWELTQEDWERIQAEQESNDIFRTFLPHMLQYHMAKQVEKEKESRHKGNCVTI